MGAQCENCEEIKTFLSNVTTVFFYFYEQSFYTDGCDRDVSIFLIRLILGWMNEWMTCWAINEG